MSSAEAQAADPLQLPKDLFSGACGGIAQVLIGQPFDIVKVRLQTTSNYTSAFQCAQQIWSQEGALAFYKGTLTPLIGIGACVSVQFGGFHFARRHFERSNNSKGPLSLTQYYTAGAFAGITNSILSGPIEHVRIRLQTQPHSPRLYTGPFDCIRTLTSHAGIARGLFRGQAVTVLREAQAYGCWFLTYEWLMARDVARRGLQDRKQVEAYRLAFYGGVAGEMLWLGSYPFDVIKSKMQTDGFGHIKETVPTTKTTMSAADRTSSAAEAVKCVLSKQKYPTMRECFVQTWQEEGIRGFWRGIGPTLTRAMPVSAATFVVAELTLRLVS